jgi:hypothetical protein
VATVHKWIRIKIFPRIKKSYNGGDEGDEGSKGGDGFGEGKAKVQVNVQDYATNVIRAWGEVFCGFGAYSIQEVFFRAG